MRPLLVDSDWSARCQTLYDGLNKRIGRRPRDMEKVGERTSLLWKLSEKRGEGKTYFDEDLEGHVENCGKYGQLHRLMP